MSPEKCSLWQLTCVHWTHFDPLSQDISYLPVFCVTLVGLRCELQALRGFGTDGEKALADAFSHKFRYAIHLTFYPLSSKHQDLDFSEASRTEILKDIFGHQEGNTFSEGLVDTG